jgi:hypothetical protein
MNSRALSNSSHAGCSNRIIAVLCLFTAILLCAGLAFGQSLDAPLPENHGVGYSGTIPYDGRIEDALAAAAAGTTIPMASFSSKATKNSVTYTDTIVGTSPFATTKPTTTINVLIIPVIVEIGSTTFDPTVDDSCIGSGITPLSAFQNSPILQNVVFDGGTGSGHAATINGVDVGTTTYPDAFRTAEFWTLVKGTTYHTVFHVTTESPWTISSAEVKSLGGGNVFTTSCADLGVLPTTSFENYIRSTVIPGIPAITPTTFALFLMKDVVTTTSSALNCLSFCTIGYHSAFGSPVQTYAVSEYDSTKGFWNSPGIENISILAHEVAEWMDDPLVTNPTPAWGNIGQTSGCQTNWEPGDPLTGTDFPAIKMTNGLTYNPQELAFWSWYYNAESTPSIGAGGKFSTNGTFKGPSKACPPGGTY